jgi:hypothetical protein
LIKLIFNTDSSKRISAEEIRDHPWYNIVEAKPNLGIIFGKDVVEPDYKILDILTNNYNFDVENTADNIKKNKFNNATTAYYLILKRKERASILKQ